MSTVRGKVVLWGWTPAGVVRATRVWTPAGAELAMGRTVGAGEPEEAATPEAWIRAPGYVQATGYHDRKHKDHSDAALLHCSHSAILLGPGEVESQRGTCI